MQGGGVEPLLWVGSALTQTPPSSVWTWGRLVYLLPNPAPSQGPERTSLDLVPWPFRVARTEVPGRPHFLRAESPSPSGPGNPWAPAGPMWSSPGDRANVTKWCGIQERPGQRRVQNGAVGQPCPACLANNAAVTGRAEQSPPEVGSWGLDIVHLSGGCARRLAG